MASVFDVAEYILSNLGYVSTMKLQKLAFYSQAYSLVVAGRPLFDEDFQAWANGPVCPDLFASHKGLFIVGSGGLRCEGRSQNVAGQDQSIVLHVLSTLGGLSGNELSELTHGEAPWKDARGNCPDGDRCDAVISKAAIRKYYGSPYCDNPAFADVE